MCTEENVWQNGVKILFSTKCLLIWWSHCHHGKCEISCCKHRHVSCHFSAFCRSNQTKPKCVLIIEIQRSLDNLPDHVTKVHHLSKLSMLFSWSFFCTCSQGNVKPFLSFISCNQRPNSMRHVPIGTPSSTWAYRTFFASLRWKLQSPVKCSLLGPL